MEKPKKTKIWITVESDTITFATIKSILKSEIVNVDVLKHELEVDKKVEEWWTWEMVRNIYYSNRINIGYVDNTITIFFIWFNDL